MPAWIEFLLSGVCHQYPEHALRFQGVALPLCARCTGLFGGAFLALAILLAWGRGRRTGFAPWWAQGALAALATWWALDGLNSFLFGLLGRPWLYEPTNALRLATGLGLGLAAGIELLPAAAQVLVARGDPRGVIQRPRELAVLLACQAALAALLLRGRLPYALAAAWSTLGVALLLGGANALLLTIVLGGEPGTLSRRRLAALAFGGALLALAEAGGLALLRRWLGV
jgi:uncharacterized membrane protein